VVSGGNTAERAYQHYQRFFGRKIRKTENFFSHGLDKNAATYIAELLSS
jgi:hypothetical protein